jgi:hypothetical protein
MINDKVDLMRNDNKQELIYYNYNYNYTAERTFNFASQFPTFVNEIFIFPYLILGFKNTVLET